MLDSDMIVMRNMDELMELDLPADWIAAVHVCACNPRVLAHYPKDWWVTHSSDQPHIPNATSGSRQIVHTRLSIIQLAILNRLP
jgi:alpha-N-acetylglucosamine transferase